MTRNAPSNQPAYEAVSDHDAVYAICTSGATGNLLYSKMVGTI